MSKVRDAIILAGGIGTRMLPASLFTPKEALPLVDTPVINHLIWEAAKAGADRVHLVLSKRKRKLLHDHIENETIHGNDVRSDLPREALKLGIDGIEIIPHIQTSSSGVADAISVAIDQIEGAFLVLLGDMVMVGEHFSPKQSGVEMASEASLRLVKMFEKTTHDFGVVARGSDTVYRLKLKNIYQQDVHISEVSTTCGCSAGKPGKETLKSLEETYVEITMDTRKFIRRKDSNVIVTFDRPVYGRVQIPITAYIRTDVVIEPGSAQFGTVDREENNEKTLKVSYAGRQDWQIKKVETSHTNVGHVLISDVSKDAKNAPCNLLSHVQSSPGQ